MFKNNIHLADGTVIGDDDMDATKVMVKIINLHPENIKKMNYTLEIAADAVLQWAINDLDFKKDLPLKKVKNPNGWKKNREKLKKNSGEAYLDSKGRTVESRILTSEEEVQTCCSHGNFCRSKCAEKFTKIHLMSIREKYNAISTYEMKNAFIANLVTRTTKQTTKLQGKESKRNYTVTYHLPDEQNHESKVCKLMFMLTLGISFSSVYSSGDSVNKCDELRYDFPNKE